MTWNILDIVRRQQYWRIPIMKQKNLQNISEKSLKLCIAQNIEVEFLENEIIKNNSSLNVGSKFEVTLKVCFKINGGDFYVQEKRLQDYFNSNIFNYINMRIIKHKNL